MTPAARLYLTSAATALTVSSALHQIGELTATQLEDARTAIAGMFQEENPDAALRVVVDIWSQPAVHLS